MRVQRVAAGDEAVAGRGGAVAEGAADPLLLQLAGGKHVGGQLGIGEDHAPEADEVDRALAHQRLRDVRQELLEVGVGGPDDHELRKALLDRPRGVHLARDADERILRRLIAVRGG